MIPLWIVMDRDLRRNANARLASGSKQTLGRFFFHIQIEDDDYVDAEPTREKSGVFDGYKLTCA